MLTIADGKMIARSIQEQLKEKINTYQQRPILTIVYVGSDPVIDNFIKYKKYFGDSIGVTVSISRIDESVSEDKVIRSIQEVSEKSDGVIVQLPLPHHYDQERVINSVPAEKDVDVLGEKARTLFSESKSLYIPPVTGAIITLLDCYHINLRDKKIVLIGKGMLVGYPTSLWLDKEGYTYDIVDESLDEANRNQLLSNADVIISGVGVPGLVTADMISEDVVLIDAGTSESSKKIIGDIDSSCQQKASFITPVPGGIGPVTIAILYTNIVNSFLKKYDIYHS